MEADSAPRDNLHRNLMVNYLPSNITTEALHHMFQQYGQIEEAKVVSDKTNNQSKGFGFVKFCRKEDAETAIEATNGMPLENKRLRVQKAAFGKGPPGPVHIYCAGFDGVTTTVNELRNLFNQYGVVKDVKQIASQPGKKSVAFVNFDNFAEAELAVQKTNNFKLPNGDTLTVRFGKDTEEKMREDGNANKGGGAMRGGGGNTRAARGGGGPGAAGGAVAGAPGAAGGAPGGYVAVGATAAAGNPAAAAGAYQPYPSRGVPAGQHPSMAAAQQAAVLQQQFLPFGAGGIPGVMPGSVAAPGRGVQGVMGYPSASVGPVPNAKDGTYCIFVYGVRNMTDTFLWRQFTPFGTVVGVQAPTGKNYGFVNMPNYVEALNAISALHGTVPEGCAVPLQVSLKAANATS